MVLMLNTQYTCYVPVVSASRTRALNALGLLSNNNTKYKITQIIHRILSNNSTKYKITQITQIIHIMQGHAIMPSTHALCQFPVSITQSLVLMWMLNSHQLSCSILSAHAHAPSSILEYSKLSAHAQYSVPMPRLNPVLSEMLSAHATQYSVIFSMLNTQYSVLCEMLSANA